VDTKSWLAITNRIRLEEIASGSWGIGGLGQTRDPELLQRAMNVRALPGDWKAELELNADGS
jgi:hypothetical protein